MPPPTMTLRGAWSLNRNISPGWSARKLAADGAQKFTSLRFGCRRSISNQSSSVTATTRLIPISCSLLHEELLSQCVQIHSPNPDCLDLSFNHGEIFYCSLHFRVQI